MQDQTKPQRPRFSLTGTATIKHLNVRKEGDDDNKILAVDIKLEVEKVDRALCDYFDDALAAFLWRGETNGLIARNLWLSPVEYAHEVELAEVKIDTMRFVGDAKKFKLQPKDGGVLTVTCSVTVEPNSEEMSRLANLVQDGALVEIIGQAGLFDAEGGAA